MFTTTDYITTSPRITGAATAATVVAPVAQPATVMAVTAPHAAHHRQPVVAA